MIVDETRRDGGDFGDKKIVDFFEQPLDVVEVINQAAIGLEGNDSEIETPRESKLYEQEVDDDLTFEVYGWESRFAMTLSGGNGDRLGFFIFDQRDDRIFLDHREVSAELKKKGINGSMFLQKCEEYLRILLDQKVIKECKQFSIIAAQTGVISWAKKNGYHFVTSAEELKYAQVLAGDEDHIITDEFKVGGNYGGYILEADKLAVARQESAKRATDGKEPDLRELSVRFELVKDI